MLNRRAVLAGLLADAAPRPGLAQASAGFAPTDTAIAPLFVGMGRYRAPDATRSLQALRLFEQGMVLTWGFNPAEAARSFRGALRHDPDCAAAAWGLAWTLGPNINADMAAADSGAVHEALARARALAPRAAPRWRELIDALAARHPVPAGTVVDEEAYARRMRPIARRHPRDADVATLTAEALMNLHPYDWWQRGGRAQPWTAGIVAQLERALVLAPAHPGANHDWVHLMERSPMPARALAAADRLRTLVPGSGHLLHMPSHIDMRLGRYADASAANERSIAADLRTLEQVDAQRAYRVGYVAHNHNFLWASASMQGRSARALEAAQAAYPAACGPSGRGNEPSGTLQHMQVLPLFTLVRFGRWAEILSGTLPPEGNEPYPLAIWHYARGTAYLRTGHAAEASTALAQLRHAGEHPALAATRVKNIHPAGTLVQIAHLTLRADLARHEGRPGDALAPLRQAVELEDAFAADEPHLWLAPTRLALGAGLLAAGRLAEAEAAFRMDLLHYPENGWSLAGLAQALHARQRAAEARAIEARARQAWRDADLPLPGPRA